MFLDLLFLALFAWVAFRVAAEGAWGAVIVFFVVLFSGLFAMNTFEPLAEWLEQKVSDAPVWRFRWDVISFLGLFTGAVLLLRFVTERLAPASLPIPWPLEHLIRWAAGLFTAYVTVAVLLTSLHLAPLPRVVTSDRVLEPAGFAAERDHFFGLAPDREWLAFNQWLSQHGLNRGHHERIFDGPFYHSGGDRGLWPSFPIRYADRREEMTRSRFEPR